MNKKYVLKKNEDILLVIKTGIKNIYKHFIIYRKENKLTNSRFCISVNKKIGNAVVRNKLKRQVRDIIMKNMVTKNEDYVIILSSSFKELPFLEKKSEILKGIE
jgi:ribonuclease P protein component